MKETTTFSETIQKEEVISITCNRCGRSEDGEHVSYASDIETWQHHFGYGSSMDTDQIEFELCDNCYKEIIKDFKHKPTIVGNAL